MIVVTEERSEKKETENISISIYIAYLAVICFKNTFTYVCKLIFSPMMTEDTALVLEYWNIQNVKYYSIFLLLMNSQLYL